MTMIVLCDIDHTLSDAARRDEMIGKVTWDEYHAASVDDFPIPAVATLVRELHAAGHQIIGFTARPAKWRQLTMEWLVRHAIPMDEILMRADTDYRPAPQIKLALANERFENAPQDRVAFILEDRDDVIAAFRALGITALQVHHTAQPTENKL